MSCEYCESADMRIRQLGVLISALTARPGNEFGSSEFISYKPPLSQITYIGEPRFADLHFITIDGIIATNMANMVRLTEINKILQYDLNEPLSDITITKLQVPDTISHRALKHLLEIIVRKSYVDLSFLDELLIAADYLGTKLRCYGIVFANFNLATFNSTDRNILMSQEYFIVDLVNVYHMSVCTKPHKTKKEFYSGGCEITENFERDQLMGKLYVSIGDKIGWRTMMDAIGVSEFKYACLKLISDVLILANHDKLLEIVLMVHGLEHHINTFKRHNITPRDFHWLHLDIYSYQLNYDCVDASQICLLNVTGDMGSPHVNEIREIIVFMGSAYVFPGTGCWWTFGTPLEITDADNKLVTGVTLSGKKVTFRRSKRWTTYTPYAVSEIQEKHIKCRDDKPVVWAMLRSE